MYNHPIFIHLKYISQINTITMISQQYLQITKPRSNLYTCCSCKQL